MLLTRLWASVVEIGILLAGAPPATVTVTVEPAPPIPKRFPARLLGRYNFDAAAQVSGVMFIPGSTKIAARDYQTTIAVWDTATGAMQTFAAGRFSHGAPIAASPDGKLLATFALRDLAIIDVATMQPVRMVTLNNSGEGSLAFSADGRQLLVGSERSDVCLIDVTSGEIVAKQPAVTPSLRQVSFSRTEGFALMCGQRYSNQTDNQLVHGCRWNLRTGEVDFEVRLPQPRAIDSLWELDEDRIAGFTGQSIVIWDRRTGTEQRRIGTSVGLSAISRDGRRVAVLHPIDGKVSIIEMTDSQRTPLSFETDMSYWAFSKAMTLNSDGDELLIGDAHGRVQHWKLRRQPEPENLVSALKPANEEFPEPDLGPTVTPPDEFGVRRFTGHRKQLHTIAILPDGRHVLSTGFDHRMLLWNLETGRVAQRYENQNDRSRLGVVCLPDGKQFLMSGGDPSGRDSGDRCALWDAATLKLTRKFESLKGLFQSVAVSRDGKLCAASGQRQDVVVLETVSGAEILRITGDPKLQGGNNTGVDFSNDGKYVIFSTPAGISTWSLERKELAKQRGWNGQSTWGMYHFVKTRPGFDQVLVEMPNGSTLLGIPELEIVNPAVTSKRIVSAGFSSDGRRVATAGAEGLVVVDLEEGLILRRWNTIASHYVAAALTPDGQTAVVGASNQVVVVPLQK